MPKIDQIITDPNRQFVWISASAGTGKTRMLVNRVLRLLVTGSKNILCITFTNAAVYEMRERLYDTTGRWLHLPEDELATELQEICDQHASQKHCARARKLFFYVSTLVTIQTVHSLCYNLVSSFPIETGIPKNCRVEELSESFSKVFARLLRESESIKTHLVEIIGDSTISALQNALYRVLNKKPTDFPCKPCVDIAVKYEKCPQSLIDSLRTGSLRDQRIGLRLEEWNDSIKRPIKKVESYIKTFIDIKTLTKKPIDVIATKSMLKRCPEIADIIACEQEKVLEFAERFYTARISKRTFHLLKIAQQCTRLCELDKKQNRYLNYDDIVHLALNLISNPKHKDWVLFCLDSRIDHILVDESQDNSIEQWSIIAQLSDEFFSGTGTKEHRSLFIVGDIKQSIYGFQNARPEYFHLMHQHFAQKSIDPLSIRMNTSFRSTKPVLSLVDKIFNKFCEQVSLQSEEIQHKTHREQDSGYLEVWPLPPVKKCHKPRPHTWSIHTKNHNIGSCILLAQTIAQTINSWINGQRILIAKQRPVTAQDIIVLVRHRNPFIDHMISELKARDIPVINRDRFNIMDYLVIQDLVNLGEFLLLQENDMALASLLKSPIFGFSEDMLFSLAYNVEPTLLWRRLQSEHRETACSLQQLINISRYYSPLNTYHVVLSKYKRVFIQRLGQSATEIIDEFINLLVRFDSESSLNTLESFIHWIKGTNPEIRSDVSTVSQAVRIMTVHNAKGMQSPIVFLPDTTSVPRSDLQLVFNDENVPLWCCNDNNSYCKKLKESAKAKEYSEYLRLLYVAMTRAEDELYISGIGPLQSGSWYDIISHAVSSYPKKSLILSPMFSNETEVFYDAN